MHLTLFHRLISMPLRLFILWSALLPFICLSAGASDHLSPAPTLDLGYTQMYNLDFAGAHITLQQWQQLHPRDPLGPVSDAAAYLFSELDRLHILESDFFTDDAKFEKREKPVPDERVKLAFESELQKAEDLAAGVLAQSPQDKDAIFARIMVDGLRGDYAALIEKHNLAGLSYMKSGRILAEQLLARDPTYYDAYLAVGVENYLLGLNAAPVRWLLRIGGAETDKEQGISKLRITAQKGHYLAPFARLLLAVAALRDKDRGAARRLLQGLASEYPQNRLYAYELARLK